MKRLDDVENKIDNLEGKLKQQTKQIDLIVKKAFNTEVISKLETVGTNYKKWLKEKDRSGVAALKHQWRTLFQTNVGILHKQIGDYFKAIQDNDYGKCTDLADFR